jgi:hypothetical protein
VELVSDIVTAYGTSIDQMKFTDQHILNPNKNNSDILRPTASAWRIWQESIKKLLRLNNLGRLDIPLPPVTTGSDWQWFWDHSTNRIFFHDTGDQYFYYSVNRSAYRTRKQKYGHKKLTEEGPPHLIPISVYGTNDTTYISRKGSIDQVSTYGVECIQSWWVDMISVEHHGDLEAMTQGFESDTMWIMSDGSVKDL